MSAEIPPHYKLLYSKEQIESRVAELGVEITSWAKSVKAESAKDLVTIPVLRGGIFFFSDLVRKIQVSVEVMPIRAMAYQVGQVGIERNNVEIKSDDISVTGRSVLLVDEVCDTGKTLAALEKQLISMGVKAVKSAAFIHRIIPGANSFKPDWVGFTYNGPEWFVGYGMDDAESWRNLEHVCVIEKK